MPKPVKFKNVKSFNNYLEYIRNLRSRRLRLGCDYFVRIHGRVIVCRFIKVTPKGFNLLALETSRCIATSHFYSMKYVGIEIPVDVKQLNVKIPKHIEVMGEVETIKEA